MVLNQTNIAKFYSKLAEFWQQGKYTDVIIECETKTFQCHRLALASASSYFDGMFGSSFKESIAENVVLSEISAATFEEVVQFVYTGDAVITSTNVCNLLSASEWLDLTGIEELCVQFIKKNYSSMTIQSTFDTFAFACMTQKTMLTELLSGYIVENFEIFFNTSRFLEISFDELRIMLNKLSLSKVKNEDALLGGITRWICHSGETRLQYCEELMNTIVFENISPMYIRSILTNALKSNIVAICQMKPSGYDEDSKLQNFAVCKTELSLHVFVKYPEEKLARIFSIKNAHNCCLSKNKISVTHSVQQIRCVASNNYSYLYCLNYSSVRHKFDQTFYACSSVIDTHSKIMLKPPPLILKRVEMCSVQNNLFVYNRRFFDPVIQTQSQNLRFNNEEMKRGIYVYNCELDDWFPVPMMKKQMKGASMATLNNVLYLIGGYDSLNKPVEIVQAYDYRIGEWQALPGPKFSYSYTSSCSTMDEKIYICGSTCTSNPEGERFDPIAGKWETVTSMNLNKFGHCLSSFSNRLWSLGAAWRGMLSIEIYDPKKNEWNTSSLLSITSEKMTGHTSGDVMHAVVFKSK